MAAASHGEDPRECRRQALLCSRPSRSCLPQRGPQWRHRHSSHPNGPHVRARLGRPARTHSSHGRCGYSVSTRRVRHHTCRHAPLPLKHPQPLRAPGKEAVLVLGIGAAVPATTRDARPSQRDGRRQARHGQPLKGGVIGAVGREHIGMQQAGWSTRRLPGKQKESASLCAASA